MSFGIPSALRNVVLIDFAAILGTERRNFGSVKANKLEMPKKPSARRRDPYLKISISHLEPSRQLPFVSLDVIYLFTCSGSAFHFSALSGVCKDY